MMKKLVALCVALAVGSFAFAQNHVETVTMTIAPGEYATLPLTYVRLDVVLKASLKFKKFEGVEIGCGRNVYCGGWLSIPQCRLCLNVSMTQRRSGFARADAGILTGMRQLEQTPRETGLKDISTRISSILQHLAPRHYGKLCIMQFQSWNN